MNVQQKPVEARHVIRIRLYSFTPEMDLIARDNLPFTQESLVDATKLYLGCKTHAELSERLGIPCPRVSLIRRGDKKVDADLVARFVRATGFTASQIYAMMGAMPPIPRA